MKKIVLCDADVEGDGGNVADFLDLVGHASTVGDLATVLLVGPLGWVGDALLLAHGPIGAPIASVCCASVALGLKKSVDAIRERPSVRRARDRALLIARATRLLDAYEHPGLFADLDPDDEWLRRHAPLSDIAIELKLWLRGIISDETFGSAIDVAAASLATWLHEMEAGIQASDGQVRADGYLPSPDGGYRAPAS